MNKEDVLTRFYANKLEGDYTYYLNSKTINGNRFSKKTLREHIIMPDEYKDLLIKLLESVGYFNEI